MLPLYVHPQASENVGMVMVFTLVSGLQDKLGEVLENFKKEKEEEIKRKEEERRKEEEVNVKKNIHSDSLDCFINAGKVSRNNCNQGDVSGMETEI